MKDNNSKEKDEVYINLCVTGEACRVLKKRAVENKRSVRSEALYIIEKGLRRGDTL